MKTLKVYDDAHQAAKILAARSGRNVSDIASCIIKAACEQIETGRASVEDIPQWSVETEKEDEQ